MYIRLVQNKDRWLVDFIADNYVDWLNGQSFDTKEEALAWIEDFKSADIYELIRLSPPLPEQVLKAVKVPEKKIVATTINLPPKKIVVDNKPLSVPDRNKKIALMYKRGYSRREIADAMGISYFMVYAATRPEKEA